MAFAVFLLAVIKQHCIAAGAPFWIGGELPVFVVRPHAPNRDVRTVTVRYEYMYRATPNIHIYIYIYIYIKNQFNALKIFNTINAGAELGLATPLTTAVSDTFSLDKKCIYSVAECLYEHIKWKTFQTHAPTSPQCQV